MLRVLLDPTHYFIFVEDVLVGVFLNNQEPFREKTQDVKQISLLLKKLINIYYLLENVIHAIVPFYLTFNYARQNNN